MENINVSMITGAYVHCDANWRDINFIPDYNKLYFIQSGQGWLKIGDNEYYPKPNQLFLMPAGILQSYSNINDDRFVKYFCHFSIKSGDINFFNIINSPHYIDVENPAIMTELFKNLLKEHNNEGAFSRLREKSILMQIVSIYLETCDVGEENIIQAPQVDGLQKVLTYIDSHLSEKIVISKLAQDLHYTPYYFTRLFKKHTNLSPSSYIYKKRLDKAKLLLKTSQMQISEIAEATGFCDVYYFSKSFKSYTGFSPSYYRST